MKLIVGLGNPGRKYEGTRHNVGFAVLEELNRRLLGGSPKSRFQGDVTEVVLAGQPAMLLAPQTFMNKSGDSVGAAVDFYKLPLADVLVICDDWNLPLGKLRVRAKGSAGGQKGLADVIRRLGTEQFARLRIGIDSPPERWDPADYVLSRFTADELAAMRVTFVEAADAVAMWAGQGVETCMNKYN